MQARSCLTSLSLFSINYAILFPPSKTNCVSLFYFSLLEEFAHICPMTECNYLPSPVQRKRETSEAFAKEDRCAIQVQGSFPAATSSLALGKGHIGHGSVTSVSLLIPRAPWPFSFCFLSCLILFFPPTCLLDGSSD